MGAAEEILEQAPARIQQYRTAEILLKVVDGAGRPVPGAKVEVTQTRHEFLFGSNIFYWNRGSDEEIIPYRENFAQLFNYATLPFYWRRFEPERGQAIHELIGQMIDWCQPRNITCKGHPLIWNHDASSPEWLPDDPQQTLALCDARVAEEVGRYRGRINVWDVTNEAADCFRKESVDKRSYTGAVTKAWQREGQVPFARRFFPIARQANPDATLLINDYRTDAAYQQLLRGLVDEAGRPVYDVIGIQSHMHGNYWGVEKTWEVCERFAEFGKPLHFTENTIISGAPRSGKKINWWGRADDWPTTPTGEKRQARNVAEFYTLLFSHPAVEAITWFDFVDNAWLGAPGGLLHQDRTPKPAYLRLLRLIKRNWWTQTSARTDEAGNCAARAFYGDYEIKVRHNNSARVVKHRHAKSGEHALAITV